MNMKIVRFAGWTFTLLLVTAVFAAEPIVSGVSLTQTTDHEVMIAYTLSVSAVVTLDIVTNSPAGWASIGGEHVQNVSGDVWKEIPAGSRAMTWCPAMSWNGNKVDLAQGGVKALVTAWSPDDPPDYMVVDISVGAGPKTVWYYPAAEFLPGGVLGNLDYRINKVVMRRIKVANVPWTMGTVFEAGRHAATEAAHPAMLDSDYYIGIFELTQGQFQTVAGFNPSSFASDADSMLKPLNGLSYNKFRCAACTSSGGNAYAGGGWPLKPYTGSFLDLLRTRTGVDFDLPSEVQWEFAGRSGTCEDQWNNGVHKQDATMPGEWKRDLAPDQVAPVACGSFEPSRWGLYDMHGNVFELCNDWYLADITALGGAVNVSATDPTKMLDGTTTGVNRVRRGGAYHAGTSSVSYRALEANPTTSASQWGFRLICPAGVAD